MKASNWRVIQGGTAAFFGMAIGNGDWWFAAAVAVICLMAGSRASALENAA